MGKRWAEIARRLRGRSDNAVKNWWNGSINRRHRISVWRETGRRGRPECEDDGADHLQFERTVSSISHAPKTILIPTHPGMIEMPMVSPVASEVSMVDSVGTAPSLVSDSSSNTSSSPNVRKMSHSRLQPLRTPQNLRSVTSLPSLNGLNGSDTLSDGSSPVHRHCDQGNSTATQYQRLQQFADVATRTSASSVYYTPQRAISVNQYQLPSFKSLIHGAEPQSAWAMETPKPPPTSAVMSVSAILGWTPTRGWIIHVLTSSFSLNISIRAFLVIVVPGGEQRLSRKQVAFSLRLKGLGGHLMFPPELGRSHERCALVMRLYFCFLFIPIPIPAWRFIPLV